MKRFYLIGIYGFFLGLTSVANADQVFSDDVIVDGNLCAGLDCANGESFGADSFKIKADTASMLFDNTGDEIFGGAPRTDWSLNTASFFGSLFQIISLSTSKTPLFISPSAETATLYIGDQFHLGVGTLAPQANLDIFEATSADIRLGVSGPAQEFRLTANSNGFFLSDGTASTAPLSVQAGADTHTLVLAGNGNVGIGTDDPLAPLELNSPESFSFFRITAEGAAVNESVDITFTGGPLGTGQLRYNIVDGDNQEMSLDADGNVVIDGTLTTAGPTCAGGCDRVFDADYALLSIEDHSKAMFENGYLPSIGATAPRELVNLSERQGAIINALEHAHIYIDQLHESAVQDRAEIASLQAQNTQLQSQFVSEIEKLSARLRVLEAE